MRIGYFVETPVEHKLTGGVRSFLDLIDQLMPMGVEPYVVVHENWALTEELKKRGIPYIVTKMFRPFVGIAEKSRLYRIKYVIKCVINYISRKKAVVFFKTNNIRLIHINSQFCGVVGAEVAKELNIPFVYHIREFLDKGFGVRFYNERKANRIIAEAARIIGISKDVVLHITERFPNTEVSLVYNGLDPDKYVCDDIISNRIEEELKCIIVGRVTEAKNQMEAIWAIERCVKGYKKRCQLNVMGYLGKDPYEKQIQTYIIQHNIEDIVKLIPFMDNPQEELQKCDVALVCSKSEAFGRVTIESMMSNLLVIGSNIKATQEIITNRTDGLLYQLGDVDELVSIINWVTEHREEARRIAINGKKKAVQQFSIQNTAKKVVEIYKEILAQ